MNTFDRLSNAIAILLLTAMAVLLLWGAFTNSGTMDELSHIPAGYSYLAKQDMRINPEHPPLIKDLAALPLLFLDIAFPNDHPAWQSDINGQWSFGTELLWRQGNPADTMVSAARLAPVLITLMLGWFLFAWARERGGNTAGLIALTLYAFNPLFLGHGNLVTTDIAAAAAMFIATYALLKYFAQPAKKTLILAGVAFGIAMLTKFSTAMLIPYFGALAVLWFLVNRKRHATHGEIIVSIAPEPSLRFALRIIGGTVLVGIIGAALIYGVYAFHVWNYPAAPASKADREYLLALESCNGLDTSRYPVSQFRDTACLTKSFKIRPVAETVIALTTTPLTRPLAQYLLGLVMVTERSSAGHTTYFLGEISNAGWHRYFPLVYLWKMPLTFHVFSIAALIIGGITLLRAWPVLRPHHWLFQAKENAEEMLRKYFPEIALALLVLLYWAITIRSPLNIGVRHLAPVLPPTIFLIARALAAWIKAEKIELQAQFALASLFANLKRVLESGARGIIVLALLGISALEVLSHSPHYLPYFNALGGGTDNGWQLVADSNYDWGQDMKRLRDFVETNGITKIYVDYFGAADARYYLGGRVVPYNPREKGPVSGWLAVSATFLQQGRGMPAKGFGEPTGYYRWLDVYTPVARAGKSIFIYHLP